MVGTHFRIIGKGIHSYSLGVILALYDLPHSEKYVREKGFGELGLTSKFLGTTHFLIGIDINGLPSSYSSTESR